jgi:hypothetical protein
MSLKGVKFTTPRAKETKPREPGGGRKNNVMPNRDMIIEKISNGVELYDLSKLIGATPSAISNNLASDPEYKEARTIGLECKLRMREIDLENAPDMVSVTRSDKLLKLAQWKLEKLHHTVYGQKLAVDSNVNINVVVRRDGIDQKITTIENDS